MTSSEPDRSASRRSLLRRAAVTGGAAVAATAGATAVATPASAANGDPLKIGVANQTSADTAIYSTSTGATLVVQNDTGAALHLQRQTVTSPSWGTVYPTTAGLAHTTTDSAGAALRHEVLTTANATMLVPIPPTRVLDSRSATGRARLLEGANRVDSQGRVLADTLLVVHLRDIVDYGDGLMGNVTVANTARGGFATVWGRGELPTASTINWWGAGQLLSNGVISQLGGYETAGGDYYPDVVAIWVAVGATAVILDVTGLLVFHPESAVINNPKAVSGAGLTADSGTTGVRAQVIKEAAESGDRTVSTGA